MFGLKNREACVVDTYMRNVDNIPFIDKASYEFVLDFDEKQKFWIKTMLDKGYINTVKGLAFPCVPAEYMEATYQVLTYLNPGVVYDNNASTVNSLLHVGYDVDTYYSALFCFLKCGFGDSLPNSVFYEVPNLRKISKHFYQCLYEELVNHRGSFPLDNEDIILIMKQLTQPAVDPDINTEYLRYKKNIEGAGMDDSIEYYLIMIASMFVEKRRFRSLKKLVKYSIPNKGF